MVELSTSGAAAAPEQAVVHIGVLSMQACSVPGPVDGRRCNELPE